jgi:flagellar biogenesis protein FliO
MRAWKLIVLILGALPSVVLSAAPAAPTDADIKKNVVVGTVDGESDDVMSVVTARLSAKPGVANVTLQDHGNFVQVIMPHTIVPQPGMFIEAKSPYFSKIALYQIEPETTAVRVFTTVEASALKKAMSAEVLNDRLVVTLDHRQLPADLLKKSQSTATTKEVTTTPVTAEDTSPALKLKEVAASVPANAIGSPEDLNNKMYIVAAFSAIMILALISFQMLRAINRKKRSLFEHDEGIEIKTLSSTNLMPKHKLVLVEACNERMLLAVSPDRVTCLSTFAKDPRAMAAKTAAAQISQQRAVQAAVAAKPTIKAEPQVGLTLKPTLKNEDKMTTMAVTASPAFEKVSPSVQANKKINIAIDDNYVTKKTQTLDNAQTPDRSGAINDVTKLIREKLKTIGSQV